MSELYAAMLMVGVTVAFGGVVTEQAIGQFSLGTTASIYGMQAAENVLGTHVALVYGTVPSPGSGGCTATYDGVVEGTGFALALFNFGSGAFRPYEVFDNGTLVAVGGLPSLSAGSMSVYNLTTGCAHPSGQSFLLADTTGSEVQFET